MAFINLNWYIALAFCLIFFIGGRQLAEVPGAGPKERKAVGLILLAFAVPALLFPLAYLPGPIAASPWYNTFRSVNRIEIFSALIAPAAGYATYRKSETEYSRYRAKAPLPVRILKPLALPLCMALISVNFAGPLLRPLSKDAVFGNNWADGGVFINTVEAASGPAALISAMYSINRFADGERSAVKGTYTDGAGTEFWYLARYAVNHGYRAKFARPAGIGETPVPSVLPAAINPSASAAAGTAFYIALLASSGDGALVVGDPAEGKLEMDERQFIERYGEPGLVLALSPPKNYR